MAARWVPTSEADLQTALDEGLLTEGHFFDAKEQLAPGPSGTKSLAVDLASFAVDGGVIIIGVREDRSNRTFERCPVRLLGLAERVDQVARSSIEPPLQVACAEVMAVEPGLGFLVVNVPASPVAPHMVAGRYRGRGDTTNIVLSDAEVRRLHERSAFFRDRALAQLRAEVERDPSPEVELPQAHMFVVGQPVTGDPGLLLRHTGPGGLTTWVRERILGGPPSRAAGTDFDPDIGTTATHVSRRADGVAISTYEVGPGRILRPNGQNPVSDTDLLDLEVHEDGGIRLFCGRASDVSGDKRLAYEAIIAGLTLRAILMAAEISEATRYGGSWDLGLAITNLLGAHASFLHNKHGARFQDVPYSADTYEQVIRIDADALATPVAVLESLYGRLHRGLTGGHQDLSVLVGAILAD